MVIFNGFGELRTPCDLVHKLEHDFKRLKSIPQDQYAAFDFFITAEHIVDWIYPTDRPARKKLRLSSPLLQITSHIANGAKHFEATAKQHKSVINIEKYRVLEPGCVEEGIFEEPLIVYLSPKEEEFIGKANIEVVKLAKLILDYWTENIIALTNAR